MFYNNLSIQKSDNRRYGLLLIFLLWGLLFSSCRQPPPDIDLTPTEHHETVVSIPVRVNHCDGTLPKLHIYSDPDWGGAYTISNMQPGRNEEPYLSIKKQLWGMYEEQSKGGRPVPLIVPAATDREYNIVVTKVINRGTVSGEIIDENKIHSHIEAIYYYPIATSIIVDSYQDLPCP